MSLKFERPGNIDTMFISRINRKIWNISENPKVISLGKVALFTIIHWQEMTGLENARLRQQWKELPWASGTRRSTSHSKMKVSSGLCQFSLCPCVANYLQMFPFATLRWKSMLTLLWLIRYLCIYLASLLPSFIYIYIYIPPMEGK